jgi:endonuclease YncB( thermonuclease family)
LQFFPSPFKKRKLADRFLDLLSFLASSLVCVIMCVFNTGAIRMLGRCCIAIILLFAFVTLLAFPSSSHAVTRTVGGVVKKVADGDTLTVVIRDGTKFRVRLYGIDAPEIRHEKKPGQPYGKEAKAALMGMVLGQKVRLDIIERDQYKRMVGIVYLGNLNVNEEMVREGWAWAYREYRKGRMLRSLSALKGKRGKSTLAYGNNPIQRHRGSIGGETADGGC